MKQHLDAIEPSGLIETSATSAQTADGIYVRSFKRVFDLIGVVILSIVLLPLITLLYIVVRCDGGQGLYGHTRIGKDGRIFRCWKLRTMVPDADEVLRNHLATCPEANALWKAERKLSSDPRITKIGNFLRRTSLDELPQLWNVLRGEMSLVGPRPVTLEELEHYGANKGIYLSAVPGMTGLWQVSGRNAVSYQRRVELDVTYVRNQGFLQDMSILLRTAHAVARGTGR